VESYFRFYLKRSFVHVGIFILFHINNLRFLQYESVICLLFRGGFIQLKEMNLTNFRPHDIAS